MTTQNAATGLSAEIVERAETCTLEDLCLACRVERDWITQLVEHGVIEPVGKGGVELRFASISVVRVRQAKRLEQDLQLNLPGIALVLDLLEEIEGLRTRLKRVANPSDRDADAS
jgi:chaperone modulatory protein CbpM